MPSDIDNLTRAVAALTRRVASQGETIARLVTATTAQRVEIERLGTALRGAEANAERALQLVRRSLP